MMKRYPAIKSISKMRWCRKRSRKLRNGVPAAHNSRTRRTVVTKAPEASSPLTSPLFVQSRCSSISVLMSSRGIPYHTHANITGSTPQYWQLIHRHDRLSEYQPSNDADTFCESSKFIAV